MACLAGPRLLGRRARVVRRRRRVRTRAHARRGDGRRRACARARPGHRDHPRGIEARCGQLARRVAPRRSGGGGLRRRRDQRSLRRRRCHAGCGRRAHGRDSRIGGRRHQGGARDAGGKPAQDAACDGRGHTGRPHQAGRAHAGAAIAHERRRAVAGAHGERSGRALRAARQQARRLAVEVGARGPEPARARACDLQVDREAFGRAPPRPRELHRGGGRHA